MEKSGSLGKYVDGTIAPANKNAGTPPKFATVELIEGVGDIPMISTENLRVKQMTEIISRVTKDTIDAFPGEIKPQHFRIELFEPDASQDPEIEDPKSKIQKVPKGSEFVAEYAGHKGFRHLAVVPDKLLSIDEINDELLSLTEWEITFLAVSEILLKRWFRCSHVYFQDRQVATLVQYLLDESKRKRVLHLLKSFEFGSSNPHF